MNALVAQLGLPSSITLESYRIWDSYFWSAGGDRLIADLERSLPAIRLGRFEKLFYFADVSTRETAASELRPLERWPDLLLAMIKLNPHEVRSSLEAVDRWLGDGPMVGVYFSGDGPKALTCTHANFIPIVERIAKYDGIIMQHTWFKTGGKQGKGESTPSELAELARRFPEQKFVCAHAGGEWERGIRAVRNSPNIFIETSGFDATAGFIEMAVRELGPKRIVFGSHLPSRSLGTELGKVTGAEITDQDRRLIFGENLRGLLNPILRKSGH
jgi:predicted TIM-barrel fold metal-dependent hydrolase